MKKLREYWKAPLVSQFSGTGDAISHCCLLVLIQAKPINYVAAGCLAQAGMIETHEERFISGCLVMDTLAHLLNPYSIRSKFRRVWIS